jgi:hypothetical protein
LHTNIFFATALDPRMKNKLSSIMTDNDHNLLWQDLLLEKMVERKTAEHDTTLVCQGEEVEPPRQQR